MSYDKENREDDRGSCPDNYKEKECCMFAKHPIAKNILLECGCNPHDAIFENDHRRKKCDQTFVLDKVIVDTTCLCRPIVKIEFSSIIYFKGEAESGYGRGSQADIEDVDNEHLLEDTKDGGNCRNKKLKVDLLFELVRVCRGVKEHIQSWRYIKEYEIKYNDKLEIKISEPFTITSCDRTCSDCYVYKMIVTGKDFDGDFDIVKVIKPDLSALAQGLCDN